jgi:hypothetical protein
MASNTLVTKNDGDIISANDPNQYKTAMGGNITPRNSNGEATANAGDLGSSSLPFRRAEISCGYFFCGMIIPFHPYGGQNPLGQGWFPCWGEIINETNYNAIHGAGSWEAFIGSSPLEGRYSPALKDTSGSGVRPVFLGANSDDNLNSLVNTYYLEDGSSPFTLVGATNNEVDPVSHVHAMAEHNHQWYVHVANASTNDQVFNSGGTAVNASTFTKNNGVSGVQYVAPGVNPTTLGQNAYTTGINGGLPNTGGANFAGGKNNVTPRTFTAIYIIRII